METAKTVNFDFHAEQLKATEWTPQELVGAIFDAQNTIRIQEKSGMDASKYYDQISVYRRVLRDKHGK